MAATSAASSASSTAGPSGMREGPYHAFGFAWLRGKSGRMSLREAVRSEATERTWTQGVTLAREGRVALKDTSADEAEYDVRVPGRPTPFEVVLGPADDEWQCTCPSKEAVCSHVVGAVLAAE